MSHILPRHLIKTIAFTAFYGSIPLNESSKLMAEVIKDDVVVSLSNTEKQALIELLDAQEALDPRLNDLNNSLQTV